MNSHIERHLKFFELHHSLIKQQSDGVTDDEALLQLPFRGNCLNWVVGHMLNSRQFLLGSLGVEAGLLTAEESGWYGRGSKPITPETESIPLSELLIRFEKSQELVSGRLGEMSEADLAELINPENGSTILTRVDFLLWHEGYHVGQLEILRQVAGKDDSIIG